MRLNIDQVFNTHTNSHNVTFWQKVKLGAIEQRWIAQMSMFEYTLCHKPGLTNTCADYLLWHLTEVEGIDEKEGDIPSATFQLPQSLIA